MSKARRAPDQNGSSASSSAEAEVKAQQGTSNELITTLIREAGVQAGIDESTTILSLSGGDSSKLGKYDFAENHDDGRYQWAGDDEERKTQVDPLPELREKHEGSNYKDFETGKAFVKGATDEHERQPVIGDQRVQQGGRRGRGQQCVGRGVGHARDDSRAGQRA